MNKYPSYYAIYQNGQYLANACSTNWNELDPYGAGVVAEVSKSLYDYLLEKSSQVPSDQTHLTKRFGFQQMIINLNHLLFHTPILN